MAGLATHRHFDVAPGLAIGEKRLEGHVVELVPATMGAIATEDRRAGKGQIADGVEGFVADELVLVAQALRVHHPVFADDDGVVERGAERETASPEALDVGVEAEGPGAADFLAEGLATDIESIRLLADQRIGEIDLDLDPLAVIGRELGRRSCRLRPGSAC